MLINAKNSDDNINIAQTRSIKLNKLPLKINMLLISNKIEKIIIMLLKISILNACMNNIEPAKMSINPRTFTIIILSKYRI